MFKIKNLISTVGLLLQVTEPLIMSVMLYISLCSEQLGKLIVLKPQRLEKLLLLCNCDTWKLQHAKKKMYNRLLKMYNSNLQP